MLCSSSARLARDWAEEAVSSLLAADCWVVAEMLSTAARTLVDWAACSSLAAAISDIFWPALLTIVTI
ncbi:hypothetical protein ACFTAO_00480 [Paenibacillus rhizoplanae]